MKLITNIVTKNDKLPLESGIFDFRFRIWKIFFVKWDGNFFKVRFVF